MSPNRAIINPSARDIPRLSPSTVIGQFVGLTATGTPLVDFPGNELGPREALCAVQLDSELSAIERVGSTILLHIDQDCIILVSFVHDTLVRSQSGSAIQPTESPECLNLSAQSEIRLSCGRSSITMRRDGKILVRGVDVVSNAESKQRIVGGSVKIN